MERKNYNGIDYDDSMDYASLMDQAAAAGNNEKAAIYERKRNAKIKGEGMNYETTNQFEQYLPKVDTPYDSTTDYASLMEKAAASGDYTSAARYEKQRNAKINGEGLDYETSDYYSKYLPENRYTYDPSKNDASSTENRYTYDPSKNDAYQRANDQATEIYDKIMNRGEFTFDLNKDKLYQQYRDLYAQMGRSAMEDTMGQGAALTGGYGSTYSQNAGQQAYNAYLQKLNEVVPELYTAAYDRYNQEGQNLMNLYTMARSNADSAYERDYNQWYNRLQLERSDEDTAYNRWYDRLQLERSDEDTAYNRKQTEEQKKLTQEETDYERKQNAWSRLSSLITTTGYQPSDEELAAAGMSANEAAYLRQYYQQQLAAASNKSGGSGGGSRRSGSGYGGGGTNTAQTQSDRSANDAAAKRLSGVKGDTSYLSDYTTLAQYERYWSDLDGYANGGMSKDGLRALINKWEYEGKISEQAANEMYVSYRLTY